MTAGRGHPGRRGQPLAALAVILGGWVAARIVMWDGLPPLPAQGGSVPPTLVASHAPRAAPPFRWSPQPLPHWTPPPKAIIRPAVSPPVPDPRRNPHPRLNPPPPAPAPQAPVLSANLSASHHILWMAAVSRLPLPAALQSAARPAPAPFSPVGGEPARRDRRWSGDGWLMLRGGGASLAGGPAPATYGASQTGAVLRYRLAPRSPHRPAAYLRATAALNGAREQEAALGVSARPVAALPIVAAVELRATRTPHGTRPRPAAMAVTELAPVPLPLALRAEAYAQAGYVGGRGATAFADGQLRVDRGVTRFGDARLRAGAGLWGGAQKGAARLDIGPAATVDVSDGTRAAARLGVDWRFRVAGDAAPASGPALTLSAGF